MNGPNENQATPAPLTPREADAVDLLVEHEFDLARALQARPDLSSELHSMHASMGELDGYATGEPDPDLVAVTLARVDRATREQADRMTLANTSEKRSGSGQWRDIVAIAAVALLVVSVAIPVLSYVKSEKEIAHCSGNLRSIAGGFEGFTADHNGNLPMAAGFMFPDGAFPDLPTHHFRASDCLDRLAHGGYCKSECLACKSDTEADPNYAVQTGSPVHPMQWRTGVRRPLVADRNPLIDLLRAEVPVRIVSLNSPTHDYRGQNVLFTDASVEFLTSPTIEVDGTIDHLYVPRDHGGLEDDVCSFADWVGSDTFLAH